MPEATTSRQSHITIRGARTHNLKNIDLTLPQRQLIVVTGVSGSGKSSLAFDTVYAEGQRRYVESLSAYARQFLERMEKPDVDRIEGICPAVAIRQKNSLRNPRSTVGTTTEILDYMRLLFARAGRTICRSCGTAVSRQTAEIASRQLVALSAGTRLLLGFDLPLVDVDDARKAAPGVESSIETVIAGLRRKGFRRILVDDQPVSLDGLDHGALAGQSQVRVVVDRVQVSQDVLGRVTDSVETCYVEGGGTAFAVEADTRRVHVFSERFECRSCKLQYEVPQPRLFSFNSPFGACSTCHGFGTVIELDMSLVVPDPTLSVNHRAIDPWRGLKYRSQLSRLKQAARDHGVRLSVPWQELNADEVDFIVEGGDGYAGIQGFFRKLEKKRYRVDVRAFLSRYRTYMTCPACDGSRLRDEARDVQVGGRRIDELCALTVGAAGTFFGTLALAPKEAAIAERILREITRRLAFLADVGLDYLTLDRLSSTLSGGEAQRINLATALGSALVDTLYVLDEPSIGLHPRDNERLVRILKQLREQGNTVLVVEHDADMIRSGDYVVDLGPGAGTQGGAVVYAGPAAGLSGHSASLDREVHAWRSGDPDPRHAPQTSPRLAGAQGDRGRRTQSPRYRRRDPAQHAHLRDGRQRVGQVHAGARRALRGPPTCPWHLGQAGRHP